MTKVNKASTAVTAMFPVIFAPNGKKYIVVILAKRPHNSPQGKDFIVKASALIYKAIVG